MSDRKREKSHTDSDRSEGPTPPPSSGRKKARKEALIDENPELKEAIEKFKEDISKRAEHVMSTDLPQKVMELREFHQQLLSKQELVSNACVLPTEEETIAYANALEQAAATSTATATTTTTSASTATTTTTTPATTAPPPKPHLNIQCNSALTTMISQVKQQAVAVMELLNNVKLWIQLSIPEVSDGGNFGVQIQEEIVEELGHAEESTYSFLDLSASYFLGRAAVGAKMAKHPTVQDYRFIVKQLDLKFYYDVLFAVLEMRDNLITIIDTFQKNEARIRNPRGAGGTQLSAMF
eukprot:GAFH01003081.1.p2 GENE.GAFH01003081.1~~GAFH01003081.1.p2  ORF type:complete len:295 (+),score=69.23 GAFH01003081.1:9-893(+)